MRHDATDLKHNKNKTNKNKQCSSKHWHERTITDDFYDVNEPRQVLSRTKWKVYQDAAYWINLKHFSMLPSLTNSVPADCMKNGEILYQKIHVQPRLSPRVIFKIARQSEKWKDKFNTTVVRVNPSQDEMTTEPKRRKQHIGRLVSAIMRHESLKAFV